MNITILSQVFKISGDLIKSSNIIKFKIETNQKLLLKTSMEIIQHLAVTFLLNGCFESDDENFIALFKAIIILRLQICLSSKR